MATVHYVTAQEFANTQPPLTVICYVEGCEWHLYEYMHSTLFKYTHSFKTSLCGRVCVRKLV